MPITTLIPLKKIHGAAAIGLTSLFISSSLFAAPVRFLVGYPTEANAPYYLDSGTEVPKHNPGYSVEIMQEVGKRIKEVRFKLVRCEFNQCLEQIKSGKLDGLFNVPYREHWLFTGKYPFTKAKVDPRQKLYGEEYALYRIKDSRVSTDGDRIYGLKGEGVAVKNNSPIIPMLKENNYSVLSFPTTTEALQAMLRRETPATVLVIDHVEALARMHPELTDLISRAQYSLYEEDYYLMLSRQFYAKKPWLAEKIWTEQTKVQQELGEKLANEYIR
ncbi:substrate-binding periplasmic protein [Oceanospirillum maris]|uniref:substrate-binding periplasmic protein n=1 Tax=Oceanospirillum maris TaxID=64977 RepID=UPI00041C6F9C|nr:transporter substrate-binding domain-containing protein [Oceanospirillum maris]